MRFRRAVASVAVLLAASSGNPARASDATLEANLTRSASIEHSSGYAGPRGYVTVVRGLTISQFVAASARAGQGTPDAGSQARAEAAAYLKTCAGVDPCRWTWWRGSVSTTEATLDDHFVMDPAMTAASFSGLLRTPGGSECSFDAIWTATPDPASASLNLPAPADSGGVDVVRAAEATVSSCWPQPITGGATLRTRAVATGIIRP